MPSVNAHRRLPPDEADTQRRLALLAELEVVDTPPEPGFDAIVAAAALATDCAIALVTLTDIDRDWFKARHGTSATQVSLRDSPGALVVDAGAPLAIEDLDADGRFRLEGLVRAPERVLFYAGTPLWVEGTCVGTLCVMDTQPRRLRPAQHELLRTLGTATAALLAERRGLAAAQSRHRLRDIAQASGDWLWESDDRQRVTWIMRADGEAPWADAPWHLGESMVDGPVLDESGQRLMPVLLLQELLARRRPFARMVVRIDAPEPVRYLSHSAVSRHDAAGDWCGFRGIARDVTRPVIAAQSVRRSAALLNELSAQVPGLIFQFQLRADGVARFPWASAGIAAIFELQPADVAADARAALDRVRPEDSARVLASICRSAKGLAHWQETFRVRLPRAGERTISAHAEPARLDDGSVLWHGLMSDVTEQLREADRLQVVDKARLAAERASQLREEFMSRVSHELRTPLNAILGFAQLLRQKPSPVADADVAQAAAHIETAGAHLLSLVNDMLDLSSLDAGHLQLRPEPVDLALLVQRCLTLVGPHAAQQGVSLALRAQPPAPTVQADRRAAKQIVFNLVGNAIKFSPRQSEVVLTVRGEGDRVALEVTDHGSGIEPQYLSKIFEPFARPRRNDGVAGSGLGLSISQRFAQAMDGRIDVRSTVGEGATFTFWLPADGHDEDPGGNDSGFGTLEDAAPAPSLGAGHVLYIEDEPVNAVLMRAFFDSLPSKSLRLSTVGTGRDGVAAAAAGTPDLILLDMNLPDMTGLEVLAALRAEPRTARISVIAVSADAMPEQVEQATGAGCDGYWTKPVNFRLARLELARRFGLPPG